MPCLCAGMELQKQGANLQLPNDAFFALMCMDPLQPATAGLLPYCTMPLFAILSIVSSTLLSAMRAYVGLCILDDPRLSPAGTLSKVSYSTQQLISMSSIHQGSIMSCLLQCLCHMLAKSLFLKTKFSSVARNHMSMIVLQVCLANSQLSMGSFLPFAAFTMGIKARENVHQLSAPIHRLTVGIEHQVHGICIQRSGASLTGCT